MIGTDCSSVATSDGSGSDSMPDVSVSRISVASATWPEPKTSTRSAVSYADVGTYGIGETTDCTKVAAGACIEDAPSRVCSKIASGAGAIDTAHVGASGLAGSGLAAGCCTRRGEQ